MTGALRIRIASFATAPAELQERGLLGWIAFEADGRFLFDSVGLRLTRDGRQTLSFPKRRDRYVVRPLNAAARDEVERAVLAALAEEVAP